jgi:nucleotide-binding universal stress UspA family protein
MSKTILLAVDAARHVPESHVSAAVAMTRELSRDTGDQVIVVHVHEFAVGRFGRLQVDCAEGQGESLVAEIVADLRSAGITADGTVREADFGHVSRKILAVGDEYDARMIVLGSSGRTDMPHMPFGSVSHRLMHLATRPVLIVPRQATITGSAEQAAAAATAG